MMAGTSCLPREMRRTILVAPLPVDRPRVEPPIVTTLRHYHSRGASRDLLHRLAGGAGHFRAVNRDWDIDGGTVAAALTLLGRLDSQFAAVRHDDPLGVDLSPDERRLALLQLIADYGRQGRPLPVVAQLAAYLSASAETIERDIDWLRSEGKVTTSRPGRKGELRTYQVAVPA
jgi:DNA-binding transcriptional ArsR family regulator